MTLAKNPQQVELSLWIPLETPFHTTPFQERGVILQHHDKCVWLRLEKPTGLSPVDLSVTVQT